MSLVDVVAAMMFLGVVVYALFAGADFGSGVWDLLAAEGEHAPALRGQIDRSIGPVWEANHVWLIYVLVFLWTAFPTGFGPIMTTLYVPWLLVGAGIVLRGAGFAFRKFADTKARARLFGVMFAASSVITPFFLGMIVGGVASGAFRRTVTAAWSSRGQARRRGSAARSPCSRVPSSPPCSLPPTPTAPVTTNSLAGSAAEPWCAASSPAPWPSPR